MALPADYHMHTPLCRHASGEPVELAARAAALGFTEIGFSDHNPMPRDDFDDWRMQASQLDEYVAKVEAARRKFPQLTIRLALEVDYLPGFEAWIRELTARHPWDYLIGSVHYISESWAIDSPFQLSKWKEHDPIEVWTAYFQRLTMAVRSGLFDIVGHADLCKKFCFYPKTDHFPIVEEFLQAAKEHDVAMELNTAGLRKDCREIYPAERIVHRAAELKIPITFGSDAHALGEVGMNFGEAVALARKAGIQNWAGFNRRRRELRTL
jgi:histidinol-phosphatase (PHP family)